MYTTGQLKNGIDAGDLMLDLSAYAKTNETATKIDLEALTSVVANKLDISPPHRHDISEIKELENQLKRKYDIGTKYSYNAILSDPEKIPYLEAPKVQCLEVTTGRETDGYKMSVDDTNGDLLISSPSDQLIACYERSTGSWVLGGTNINAFISETNAVLKNHYDALCILAKEHGLQDTDGNDDTKITPGTVETSSSQ